MIANRGTLVDERDGRVAPRATTDHGAPGLKVLDEERFQVGGERGRGGVGLVFEASDRLLGRQVAIKQLQHSGGPGAARFVREARFYFRSAA